MRTVKKLTPNALSKSKVADNSIKPQISVIEIIFPTVFRKVLTSFLYNKWVAKVSDPSYYVFLFFLPIRRTIITSDASITTAMSEIAIFSPVEITSFIPFGELELLFGVSDE